MRQGSREQRKRGESKKSIGITLFGSAWMDNFGMREREREREELETEGATKGAERESAN